jgi:hypothetical protein
MSELLDSGLKGFRLLKLLRATLIGCGEYADRCRIQKADWYPSCLGGSTGRGVWGVGGPSGGPPQKVDTPSKNNSCLWSYLSTSKFPGRTEPLEAEVSPCLLWRRYLWCSWLRQHFPLPLGPLSRLVGRAHTPQKTHLVQQRRTAGSYLHVVGMRECARLGRQVIRSCIACCSIVQPVFFMHQQQYRSEGLRKLVKAKLLRTVEKTSIPACEIATARTMKHTHACTHMHIRAQS